MTDGVAELARIGLIELSTSVALSAEAPTAMPPGVTSVLSRLRFPGDGTVTAAALDEMVAAPRFEEAAVELADAAVDVIAFACTTGSLLHGPGYDAQLADRLQRATGVRSTTTATAVLQAFAAVGARRIAVGTPYVDDLNDRERDFFAGAGLEVVSMAGLGLTKDALIARVGPDEVLALAERAWREDADALFLSCTNLRTLSQLAALERRFGVPVISSNAATLWWALQLAGQSPGRADLGRLLSGAVAPRDPLCPDRKDDIHVSPAP